MSRKYLTSPCMNFLKKIYKSTENIVKSMIINLQGLTQKRCIAFISDVTERHKPTGPVQLGGKGSKLSSGLCVSRLRDLEVCIFVIS